MCVPQAPPDLGAGWAWWAPSRAVGFMWACVEGVPEQLGFDASASLHPHATLPYLGDSMLRGLLLDAVSPASPQL